MPEKNVNVTAQFEEGVITETETDTLSDDVNPTTGIVIGFAVALLSGGTLYVVRRRNKSSVK